MNMVPHWTSYLAALLTPIVAIFGLYIAWRQALTAKRKLKFELFEKRFAVYEEAKSLIAMVMANVPVTEESLQKYRHGVSAARWLFDKNIEEYLQRELYAEAYLVQQMINRLNEVPINEDRVESLRLLAELQVWFGNQQDILDSMIGRYLEIQH